MNLEVDSFVTYEFGHNQYGKYLKLQDKIVLFGDKPLPKNVIVDLKSKTVVENSFVNLLGDTESAVVYTVIKWTEE